MVSLEGLRAGELTAQAAARVWGLRTRCIAGRRSMSSSTGQGVNATFFHLLIPPGPSVEATIPIYAGAGRLLYLSTNSKAHLFQSHPPGHTQKQRFTSYLDLLRPNQVDT